MFEAINIMDVEQRINFNLYTYKQFLSSSNLTDAGRKKVPELFKKIIEDLLESEHPIFILETLLELELKPQIFTDKKKYFVLIPSLFTHDKNIENWDKSLFFALRTAIKKIEY